jgi:putative inorganic carbon (hco3(-)) transporter
VTVRRLALYSLAVTAACLPLYVVRWRYGPLPTTLLELLIEITALAWFATLITERRLPAARTPLDIFIALLLVAGVLGVVVAPDRVAALGIYRAYFLEAVFVFYVAVDLLRTREDVQPVLVAFAFGASVMAIGQITSVAWAYTHHQLHITDAPAFLNTSPNADAMYLEPPLAFALAFTMFPSRPRERWIAAPLLALVFVAVVSTLSRASYLGMAVLAVVLVLSLQSTRRRIWAIAGIATVGLLTLEVPFVFARLLNLARSVVNRTSLWHEALEMLSQRPIFGAGIGGFATRVAPFRPRNQQVHIYPHDVWLTTWSEIGILGVVAFALIFFSLLWRGIRALPRATDVWRPVLWGAVGALVLYLVHGLFDSPYWKNDLSVEFWLLAALQIVAMRATRTATPR